MKKEGGKKQRKDTKIQTQQLIAIKNKEKREKEKKGAQKIKKFQKGGKSRVYIYRLGNARRRKARRDFDNFKQRLAEITRVETAFLSSFAASSD